MRTRSVLATLAAALLVLAAACGDDDGNDAADDDGASGFTVDGTQFTSEPGDRFTITLESNASTGYSWALETVPPADVVVLVDDEYVASDSDLVGAASTQRLTFEAVGDGSTSLDLWYVRPFDDPPEPAERPSSRWSSVAVAPPIDGPGSACDQSASAVGSESTWAMSAAASRPIIRLPTPFISSVIRSNEARLEKSSSNASVLR